MLRNLKYLSFHHAVKFTFGKYSWKANTEFALSQVQKKITEECSGKILLHLFKVTLWLYSYLYKDVQKTEKSIIYGEATIS